jgi:hypothetical protein
MTPWGQWSIVEPSIDRRLREGAASRIGLAPIPYSPSTKRPTASAKPSGLSVITE